MELQTATELTNTLIREHGLTSLGWYFEYDSARRRFGACHYRYKKITLSESLVKLNDEATVKNVILHEIAHALVGFKHHHNHVWKAKAREIGCTGDRCYKSAEVVTPIAKYTGTCPNGHTVKKHKKPRNGSCPKCCSRYNPNYLFTWTQNF